jgi:hypothetical protein
MTFSCDKPQKSGTNRPVILVFRVTTRVIFNDFWVQICIFDRKFAVSTFLIKQRKRLNCVVFANSAVCGVVAGVHNIFYLKFYSVS